MLLIDTSVWISVFRDGLRPTKGQRAGFEPIAQVRSVQHFHFQP